MLIFIREKARVKIFLGELRVNFFSTHEKSVTDKVTTLTAAQSTRS